MARRGFKVPRDAEGYVRYQKLCQCRHDRTKDSTTPKHGPFFSVVEYGNGFAVAKMQPDRFGKLQVVCWLATFASERDADNAARQFNREG